MKRVPHHYIIKRELGVHSSSSPPTNVMNQSVLAFIEEVEEGWVKVWQVVFFGERVHRYPSNIWLSVEVECSP